MGKLTYNQEIADEICLKISTSSSGLSRLCEENPKWPCRQAIFEWRIKVKEFGDKYADAKRQQIENFVDEIIDIADDSDNDKFADGKCNAEFINRSRLRIDTRKWIAAKLAPKIYGERTETNSTVTITDSQRKVREIDSDYSA